MLPLMLHLDLKGFAIRIRQKTGGWFYISCLGAAVVILPLLYVMGTLLSRPNENWAQIRQYLLKDYILQTAELVLFTGLLTAVIGLFLAWLIAFYEFPFMRFWRWALVLPIAIPPYIAAFTYSEMFSFTGIIQTTLRNQLGITPDPRFFDVMSVRGAVFIFTMFLYPYVYIIVRSFLERQCSSYIESARLLGRSPLSLFFRLVLPLSRPALIGGVMLVAFEVLGDYGLVSHFGIQTISTAIFQTWFGMYDVESAMRLAAWLMIGVIGIFLVERILRRRLQYSGNSQTRPLVPVPLKGMKALGATLLCLLVFSIAFLFPVAQLLVWAGWTYQHILTVEFVRWSVNTLSVAFLSTACIMIFAVITANVCRLERSPFTYILARLVTAGYSIPGTIVAIGVLSSFLLMDRVLAYIFSHWGLAGSPPVLSLSLAMLLTGYVIRFMATGYNAVEAGFSKVNSAYTEASRLLGYGVTRTFFKVDFPLIKGSMLSGFILTFVEIVKELPLTLLLRPFNFETLATKAYQYANDEQIMNASIPSLFIISVSMVTVYLFDQIGKKME